MIVVMGVTGAGKSYLVNQLAGREVVKEGAQLDSCTQECQLVPIDIGNSKLMVMDTPGFDDTERPDSEILSEIALKLSAQYELGIELKGIVYIHRITDNRYTRSSVKTFEVFKKIVGAEALKNVLLVTSRWHEIDQGTGAERERQLKDKFWAYMIGHGSNISRFHGDRSSAVSLVSQLLCQDTVVLQLQRELVDEGKLLDDTAAGTYVSDGLEKLKKQYQEDLASLERLKQDLLDQDAAMKRQLRKDWEAETEKLQQLQQQQVSLQRAVGSEVHREIEQKKSRLSKGLPIIPAAVSILAAIVGIPPGVTEIFTGWFADLIPGFDFSF
ncbi:P-loop containing nucleoside triphosphate hydrolase protein [Lojkania enalia]|uniref:P-loop containing nucleoside triphosphate hydrolase protein n=1 Tax=Lojkania enalia TaxID=147567 RepID=A0A9P4N064_9PLEO|nr:P-loop containing nucleoside triphosphate hydrolase protein [Didymosphaeria enalia]